MKKGKMAVSREEEPGKNVSQKIAQTPEKWTNRTGIGKMRAPRTLLTDKALKKTKSGKPENKT